MTKVWETKADRIAAARAEMARRIAEDPDAYARSQARMARLAAAAKRERERFAILVLGGDRPAPTIRREKRQGKKRSIKVPIELDPEIESALARREAAGLGKGTPETHAKAHVGALAQLHANGVIDREQLEWADQIASAADAILADVKINVASLEARVDVARHAGGMVLESLSAARRAVTYRHWLTLIPTPREAVLDMLTRDQIGYTVAAKRHRMDHRRAKGMLLQSIDLWPTCVDYAVRLVTREALQAAHEELA